VLRRRSEEEPHSRLIIEAAVVVVLELRPTVSVSFDGTKRMSSWTKALKTSSVRSWGTNWIIGTLSVLPEVRR